MNDIPLMIQQEEAIRFAMSRMQTVLAHGMRLGKTRTAIEYADRMGAFPALVVCPASLRWVWVEQIKLWAPHLKAQVLEDGNDIFKRGADFHIVSYEYITKTKKIPATKLRLILADEGHYLKNLEAQRTQRIWALMDRLPLGMIMSGTIMPSRPAELYTILRMVRAIKMDWMNYAKHFCNGHTTPFGFDARGASNTEELSKLLQPVMHYRTREMVMDNLPDKDRQVVALDLPLHAREKEFSLRDLQKVDTPIALEGLTDLMVFIGEQKAHRAIEFIENLLTQTEKVVVFFQYHTTADIIQQGLEAYGLVRYDGKTNKRERSAMVSRFQTKQSTRVMLMQIKTAVGMPLWAADTTVFVEASWVPGDLEQAEARVESLQEPKPTMHYYLTIHGSIDEHQLRRTLEKSEIIQKVIDPAAAIL